MKHLLAALLFSTATFACTKTPDVAPGTPAATDPAPTAAPAPATAPAATAPAPVAAAPAPADVEATPDLVEAAPGVQVVADYDVPVFFNSGLYWRFNDGGWYSSSVYTGGWQRRATPPSVIVHLDRPERFVHFRPSGYVARRRAAPQREWHPEPVHAQVRVEPPRAEVHVDPRVEVRVPARAEIRVTPPRVDVRVDPRAEVHVRH